MAVLREWRAEIRRPLKDEYVAYVRATGSYDLPEWTTAPWA